MEQGIWKGEGHVFTREDGAMLHPDRVTKLFDKAVTVAKVPRIRLHDLRHGSRPSTSPRDAGEAPATSHRALAHRRHHGYLRAPGGRRPGRGPDRLGLAIG